MKLKPLLVSTFFLACLSTRADPVHMLKHNPFMRPPYLHSHPSGGATSTTALSTGLDLRATLSAGRDSMVNIAGKFYRIGDVIKDYRLLSVGDNHAVFRKNGKTITIKVNE